MVINIVWISIGITIFNYWLKTYIVSYRCKIFHKVASLWFLTVGEGVMLESVLDGVFLKFYFQHWFILPYCIITGCNRDPP